MILRSAGLVTRCGLGQSALRRGGRPAGRLGKWQIMV